jgi:hypothetical protein
MQPIQSIRNVTLAFLTAAAAFLVASTTAAGQSLSYDAIYDPDSLLHVEITIDPADWDVLRNQTRSMIDAMAKDRNPDSAEGPYTYFRGDVKINGVEIKDVGVRKKGFIGSLDRNKPSLKLHFKKFQKGRKIAGLEKLTLNNNKQDPAALHQFLAYKTFRDAGLPASRANHAFVSVNGESLGIYSNVESVDDEFIKRHFDGKLGSLYEGTITDFVPGWADKFETKVGRKNDFSDIHKVIAAAAVEDDSLLEELGKVVDLDQFYRFWATEVLIQHWDGYTGDRNNYFVYRPGDTDRFVFLPWGADYIAARNPFWQFNPPASVYAASTLSRRLYKHPLGREQYRAALRDLLTTVWNEEELLSEVDRIQALVGDHLPKNVATTGAVERVKTFIQGRREAVMAELDGEAPGWPWPLGEPAYVKLVGSASGKFAGQWGTLMGNPFSQSEVSLEMSVGDKTMSEFAMKGATAGVSQQPDDRGNSVVRIMARTADSPKLNLVNLSFAPAAFKPGTHDVDTVNVIGAVLEIDPTNGAFKFVGLLQGTVTLDQVGTENGDTVSGSFNGEIMSFSGME